MNAKKTNPFSVTSHREPQPLMWLLPVLGAMALMVNGAAAAGRASAPHLFPEGYTAALANGNLIYAEVRVEQTVSGSYYCAIVGDGFYMGLQQGGSGYPKHVHFSVWDPAGDIAWRAPEVTATRFGGEGTGWATYFPFDWQTNMDYRLCVRITHEGANTVYLAYFFDPAASAWKHLVTIPRTTPGGTLGSMDSFVEDFGAHCEWARSYLVGNTWARQFDGQWVDLQTNRLSCEGVAIGDCHQTNYDADVVAPYWLRLETGDDTVNDTPSGSQLVRGPGTQPSNLPDESNHSPQATDAVFSVLTNGTCSDKVTATDEEGNVLQFATATNPSHGTVALGLDGRFSYRPLSGYQGADSFAFRVTDGQGGASTGRVSLVVVPRIAPVEKTGQTNSYRTGDDGHIQRGVSPASPRFTDHSDGTVTDNNTGLIWLKSANPFGARTWSAAIDLAHALASGMAGLADGSVAGDWRLPNDKELLSLLDYGQNAPLLPVGHRFTGVVPTYYWTSTTMGGAGNALGLDLGSGHQTTWGKEENQWYVWPVRGQSQSSMSPAPVEKSGATTSYRVGDDGFHQAGVPWAGPRFTDNGDGTVTDNNTRLVWLKDAGVSGPIAWSSAIDFANTLANGQAGLSDGSAPGDWRLSNMRELFSLFDHGHQPLLPSGHPFLRAAGGFWTSTTSPINAGQAYYVGLYDANTYAVSKAKVFQAWPVRDMSPIITWPWLSIRVSNVELCWDTCPSTAYQIMYLDSLSTNGWLPLGGVILGTGSRFCTNDAIWPGQPQRFYQLRPATGR